MVNSYKPNISIGQSLFHYFLLSTALNNTIKDKSYIYQYVPHYKKKF